ncbi:uncharacterized protein H6S33_001669 [Morchella sextelata]|uniref:uncharacterized protein n=1 Tax=Morchella sextelata TaxID=1174677 RepID=UPI001D03EB6E|nr:uncharacterized protein H6S33_001669 [Morchella sextelata]KAH0608535.1 hypothetical protein H6S33_001669 [Morchella sextelata]
MSPKADVDGRSRKWIRKRGIMGVFSNRSDKLCGTPRCQFGSVQAFHVPDQATFSQLRFTATTSPMHAFRNLKLMVVGGRQGDLIFAFSPPFLKVPTLKRFTEAANARFPSDCGRLADRSVAPNLRPDFENAR